SASWLTKRHSAASKDCVENVREALSLMAYGNVVKTRAEQDVLAAVGWCAHRISVSYPAARAESVIATKGTRSGSVVPWPGCDLIVITPITNWSLSRLMMSPLPRPL